MKTDLDALMEAQQLDALLVTGPGQHNPAMVYLTGGGHLTGADLIKPRGGEIVLFYNPMERDEAAKTGLKTKNLSDYNLLDLIKQANGDFQKAYVKRYQLMFTDLGITSGRVGLYGQMDAGRSFTVFSDLQTAMPDLEFVGDFDGKVLLAAMATKEEQEVERIRKMGQITVGVVGQVAEFLTSHRVRAEVLVKSDGSALTIADVKSRINLWLAEAGAENPEGTIFAIGRDAGVPHSSGNPADFLRLGQSIVFDIFPCEAGGGYFYDFTRTWSLGYATDELQALYEDVRSVYNRVMGELRYGAHCKDYQKLTCDLFEAQGHPTVQTNPQTQEGYVHSLGHGLGLHVHERPSFGANSPPDDVLAAGVVITVEPGLYYPERGMGVRLEDTVWVRPDGQFEILADYPLDLVLPVK
jgi:Xaa-Pro aminopeptidase